VYHKEFVTLSKPVLSEVEASKGELLAKDKGLAPGENDRSDQWGI